MGRPENPAMLEKLRTPDELIREIETLRGRVSDLERVEGALRVSEERVRLILESSVEAMITINEEGIMEEVNPAARRLFGYSADEMIGRDVGILMPMPHSKEHNRYIAEYLRSGKARIIGIGREVDGKRRDGAIFPMYISVSESRAGGKTLFTGFIQDLSERKQHEREARQWAEELERQVGRRTERLRLANLELEHIAFVISHDLRAPLRGIRNYVDFLSEDLDGRLSGENAEDWKRLKRATDELDQMIDLLLDYSRIGHADTEPTELDVGQLVRDISDVAAAEPDRQVTIQGHLPRILAPQSLVRRIFQNLIVNGLHYNKSEPRRVVVSALPGQGSRAGFWRFTIQDNGIGIKPEYHHKIFDMFQRLHTSDEYSGSGIGLAAVRKAVQFLGGRLWLESSLGRGSSFHVELPEVWAEEKPPSVKAT